jgi:hypothetical protein
MARPETPGGAAGDDPRQLELVDEGGAFVVREPGPSARDEIRRLRETGWGYQAIARSLNERGWASPRGGDWTATTVERHADPERWREYMRAYRRARRNARGIE